MTASTVVLLVAALPLAAGNITLPSLSPGTPFHLIFVTSGTRDGTSANHADYNAFVQGAASASTATGPIAPHAYTWQALVSTATQNANGIPLNGGIYLLDGTQVSSAGLLFAPAHGSPINVNEHGNAVGATSVYTGSTSAGSGIPGLTLGSPNVAVGSASDPGTGMFNNGTNFPSNFPLPIYAISQPLIMGGSQLAPVLPGAGGIAIGPGGVPVFTFENVPGGFWYDPPIVSGFEYLGLSGSLFSSIQLPTGFANPFEIWTPDGFGGYTLLMSAAGGATVDFGAGVDRFRVLQISPLADAGNPAGFPTLINFTTANGSFQMTGLSDVPEPGAFGLVAAVLFAIHLKKRK